MSLSKRLVVCFASGVVCLLASPVFADDATKSASLASRDADDPASQPVSPLMVSPLPAEAPPPMESPPPPPPRLTNSFGDFNVLHQDHFRLELGGMAQLTGEGEYVKDPYKYDVRAYLFLAEARLRTTAHYDDFKLNIELALGGEASVAAPNPGVSLSLLDFNLDIPLPFLGKSYIKVGQSKVPYGRENLTYSGFQQFAGRSIDYQGFVVGRDVGASVNLQNRFSALTAGIYTGGGRDVPQEFIPEKLGLPLLVVRATLGNVDDDLYVLKQNDLDGDSPKAAISINGLVTKDSLIGHSTVLNVKLADKSLVLNPDWNPYIAQAPFSQGVWFQTGIDGALRVPITKDLRLSGEFELNYSQFTNDHGAVRLFGARIQGGLVYKRFELAARYAMLLPDTKFAYQGQGVTGSALIHEITPAISYYLYGHMLKLVADLPIQLQSPVFVEPKVGSYVAMQLPNQATVLGIPGGTVSRETVVMARLMLEAQF